MSPAKEASPISGRWQIKPTSFYCNFYPSRISPSLQVQATETLIPIQMSLQGSSFIRKKNKISPNTPKQGSNVLAVSSACIHQEGRERALSLTWPLLLEGRNATLPSLLRLLPLPATAFINSDYLSVGAQLSCELSSQGYGVGAKGWSLELRSRKKAALPSPPLLRLRSMKVGVEEEGTSLAETRDDRSIFPAARRGQSPRGGGSGGRPCRQGWRWGRPTYAP